MRIQDVYNIIAPDFDRTRHTMWPCVSKLYTSHIKNTDYVLDVGCGNGKNIMHDNALCYELCDLSSSFVSIVKNRYPSSGVALAYSTSLPYRTNTFDLVMSVAVLHHLQTPTKRIDMMNELIRVCSSGGIVFITVWAYEQKKKYGTQDAMIPWKHRDTSTVYYRYYHLFDRDEFFTFVSSFSKVEPIQIYYENDNWIAVLKKTS